MDKAKTFMEINKSKIQKEKEKIEEQNIFTSNENHKLRQKISELKLELEVLRASSSNSSLYSSTKEEDYDFKKNYRIEIEIKLLKVGKQIR